MTMILYHILHWQVVSPLRSIVGTTLILHKLTVAIYYPSLKKDHSHLEVCHVVQCKLLYWKDPNSFLWSAECLAALSTGQTKGKIFIAIAYDAILTS